MCVIVCARVYTYVCICVSVCVHQYACECLLTHGAAGCDGGCLQQHLHDAGPHCGGGLAVGVQVAQELLDDQVRVLGLEGDRWRGMSVRG